MFGFGSDDQKYKVKLESGKILGPVNLKKIKKLIRKKEITGQETAREYPEGDWKKITEISEIAEILAQKQKGELPTGSGISIDEISATDVDIDKTNTSELRTKVLDGPGGERSTQILGGKSKKKKKKGKKVVSGEDTEYLEKTVMDGSDDQTSATIVDGGSLQMLDRDGPSVDFKALNRKRRGKTKGDGKNLPAAISQQETQMMKRGTKEITRGSFLRPNFSAKEIFRIAFLSIGLGYFGYEAFLKEEPKKTVLVKKYRVSFPTFKKTKNPDKSKALFQKGLPFYVEDTLSGYRKASRLFEQAASEDQNNIRAIALLASSYLNLIDVSYRDEQYFGVVSKLIELSKKKTERLAESLIAEVEFQLALDRLEAALGLVSEFIKTRKASQEIYYYLAKIFFLKGETNKAIGFLSRIQEERIFSAKVFYLRGEVAEKFGELGQAIRAYAQAVGKNPRHVRSHLKLADLYFKQGNVDKVAPRLKPVLQNPSELSPVHLARAFFIRSQLRRKKNDTSGAIEDLEKAVKLHRQNSDYLVELYSLRHQAGEKSASLKKKARMYFFLSAGQKLARDGKYEEARIQFFQAREVDPKSPIPLVRIGDVFLRQKNIGNALKNFEKAYRLAPKSASILSRYIEALILSFEWEKSQRAISQFAAKFGDSSTLDRLIGDLYYKQKRYQGALNQYRKALSRENIDPEVYIKYADTLFALKKYKEAPFYYAMARRFDPSSIEAILGTSKVVTKTESLQAGIRYLRNELQNIGGNRPEITAGIAELQLQRGDRDQAKANIDLAIRMDENYSYAHKLLAEYWVSQRSEDKKALDKALYSYKSYSDRNPSDPSGYLRRYEIFIQKVEYNKAEEELDKIYARYPKYPGLHYYRGLLYSYRGNEKKAIKEFNRELKNHRNNVNAMLSLGKEYVKVGLFNEALSQFTRAMQVAPAASEPKHQAGWANYLLKNFEGAKVLLQTAFKMDSGNPIIVKRLAEVYKAVGDAERAAQAMQTYRNLAPDG